MSHRLSTATRTVLFTDLADYTGRVSRSDREGLRKILADHEQVVRPVVEARGGRIVKNLGDSFLCVFDSATDALHAAREIFIELGSKGDEIRIALTTGDVEEIDGDVFGSAVNVAARILDLTPAGQCWFGLGARLCMHETELPWEPVGRFALRGIPEEQECHRVVPDNRCWLPQRVLDAIDERRLVRITEGDKPPQLPGDPVILLEGFAPDSKALRSIMAKLPVLDPQAFYLTAYDISMGDRQRWLSAGHGIIIGKPETLNRAILTVRDTVSTHSSETLSLDPSETMFVSSTAGANAELLICGLALPAVPFSDIVASYSYALLPDGRWVTSSRSAILRVDVSSECVSLTGLGPAISLDGAMLELGTPHELQTRCVISTPNGDYEFVPTSRYAAVILHDSDMHLGMRNGQTVELGRNPASPGIAFPNRPGQENINWCTGQRAEEARANGFTLDRVLAGRQQAAVELLGESLRLTPLHKQCPTYILRDGRLGQAKKSVPINFGDMIVAGTTVVAARRSE